MSPWNITGRIRGVVVLLMLAGVSLAFEWSWPGQAKEKKEETQESAETNPEAVQGLNPMAGKGPGQHYLKRVKPANPAGRSMVRNIPKLPPGFNPSQTREIPQIPSALSRISSRDIARAQKLPPVNRTLTRATPRVVQTSVSAVEVRKRIDDV